MGALEAANNIKPSTKTKKFDKISSYKLCKVKILACVVQKRMLNLQIMVLNIPYHIVTKQEMHTFWVNEFISNHNAGNTLKNICTLQISHAKAAFKTDRISF